MPLNDFFERVRQHYLEQFRALMQEQRALFPNAVSEIKVQLSGEGNLFRLLWCVDLLRGDPLQVVELQADRFLSFDPLHMSMGRAQLTIEHLRWDDVLVLHDASQPLGWIDAWFDRWFDPDEKRLDERAEFANAIHSLAVEPQQLSVDFGSAPGRALLDLLNLIEQSGATDIRVTASRAEEAPADLS